MTLPSRGLPDQTRGSSRTRAGNNQPSGPARYRGHGLQMVEQWTNGRHAAGLPNTDHWDGALVSLAMALMSGRDVEALASHFAHSRRDLMSREQIEQDLELGIDALRSSAETALDPSAIHQAALAGIRQITPTEHH